MRRRDFGAQYLVGGWAQLTTVTSKGIEQRILQRWPEDKIGELIKPTPIDWNAWNVAHGFRVAPGGKHLRAI